MESAYRNFIPNFVRYNRNSLNMTQEELAVKAGVGLRFIRELEQGKETLRMDKVNQVLQLFGYTLSPGPGRQKDPYEILLHHTNKNVSIFLKNKKVLYGFILEEIKVGNELKSWMFVSNNNAIEYQKTKDEKLAEIIPHDDIENVVNL